MFSHITQNSNTSKSIIYTPTHLTIDHSLLNPHRSSQSLTLQTQTLVLILTLTQTSRCATPSLKPTLVLTTNHSHSNAHRSSVCHSSNPNTLKPKHWSSVSHSSNPHSHSSNLAPTDLVILQTLTLTQTLRCATEQPPHSSNLAPLLNLNLKVGTPSQSACFD